MAENCTIYKTASFIGKRWTLLILLELHKDKSKRYFELKNGLSEITPKILSARLKELAKEKLIIKKIDTTSFPIKCEYSLTKSGRDFIKVIKNIKKWALKWKVNSTICEKADCKNCSL